jgi:aldehyde dehydrogenase (NAD+)
MSSADNQTIFGDVTANMKIVKEEEVIAAANDSIYGLASAVFSQNISRGHRVAQALKSGTVWVNCYNELHPNVPFGGFKQSGVGRELGEYAIENYTQIKAVHINIGGQAAIGPFLGLQ